MSKKPYPRPNLFQFHHFMLKGVMMHSGQEKTDSLADTFNKVHQLDNTVVIPLPFPQRTDAKITGINITSSKVFRTPCHLDVTKASGPETISNIISTGVLLKSLVFSPVSNSLCSRNFSESLESSSCSLWP